MKTKYLLLAVLFCSSFTEADTSEIYIPTRIKTEHDFRWAVWHVCEGSKDASWLDGLLNSENSSYYVSYDQFRHLIFYFPYETEFLKHTLERHFKQRSLSFSEIVDITSIRFDRVTVNTKNHKEYQECLFPLETLKAVLSFVNTTNGYTKIIDLINDSFFNYIQKEAAIKAIKQRYEEIVAASFQSNS